MATEDEELPVDLLEDMTKLDSSLENCKDLLKKLTSQPSLDTKNMLQPMEKAKLDLTTTYALNSLFWVYLVTQGVSVTEHQVKGELDRVKPYMGKIKSTEEKIRGATLKIDKEAAKRFVKSALWTEKEKSNTDSQRKSEGEFEETITDKKAENSNKLERDQHADTTQTEQDMERTQSSGQKRKSKEEKKKKKKKKKLKQD